MPADLAERPRTKQQPAIADQVDQQRPARETCQPVGPARARPHRRPSRLHFAIGNQQQALVRAPQRRTATPRRARGRRAPSSAEVPAGLPRRAAAAAERDVQIVAQPRRERDVPVAPELAGGADEVREAEVHVELDAQQLRDAARDVRVAGEVAVDLQRERVGAEQDLERRSRGVPASKIASATGPTLSATNIFLKSPIPIEPQAGGDVGATDDARRGNLREQRGGAQDRSRRRGAGSRRRRRRSRADSSSARCRGDTRR